MKKISLKSLTAMLFISFFAVNLWAQSWTEFEGWYCKTWIRRETKQWNLHRSYDEMRVFLSTGDKGKLVVPDAARPVLTKFRRLWEQ